MSFESFLEQQDGIYESFKAFIKSDKGVVPKSHRQGAYMIAFRHSDEITNKIMDFSNKVSKLVRSIKYDKSNAHTTIIIFQAKDDFVCDTKMLERLSEVVEGCLPLLERVVVDYDCWLLNQDAGVAAGKPNSAFYGVVEQIVNQASKKGMEFRLPWGAHITVARFLESKSKDEIKELIQLFKTELPIGKSKPVSIDVGYLNFSSDDFKYFVFKSFNLSNS
ncbi:hypothetical protein HN592_04850 [Candidatus Woesearchaeota archaeon]|jgi:hypothetical protein|nr:hypothetical protein [Candidatus Woesearchaeota archaeon]MBT4368542.1 hypothetical protein [Candidatus Woesearchaeota archaeon]MBT4713031.1 hypothetical protein [Candidatus Woesearchaeota archaeon]MBT6639943.1 hypothetical protein [Candidatus Woesearchaeota archaeon]MBT7134115.1 hypothetical protein [Candidatus Woesearchaeota archaeon]